MNTFNDIAGDPDRSDAIQDVTDRMLNALCDLPVEDWGPAVGCLVSSLINAKIDACDALEEAAAIKRERYGDPVPPVNE